MGHEMVFLVTVVNRPMSGWEREGWMMQWSLTGARERRNALRPRSIRAQPRSGSGYGFGPVAVCFSNVVEVDLN